MWDCKVFILVCQSVEMKSSREMLESEDDLLCDVRQGNGAQSPKDVGNKSWKELGPAEV